MPGGASSTLADRGRRQQQPDMDLQQVDVVHPQPRQALLHALPDVLLIHTRQAAVVPKVGLPAIA